MADKLTIDVDAQALLAAFDALGAAAESLCREAAHVTAQRVQAGAQARAQWGATGKTREAITIDEGPEPLGGYRVYVGPTVDDEGWRRPANLPLWLEFGTRKMAPHPFLFAAARVEEAPHLDRIGRAVQAAIDAQGLG
jgi:hypothetical protein